jgi:phosphoacetylglucosamine mutase
MNYGTSGFRAISNSIIDISFKIGKTVSYLCHKNKKNYGIMITASHNHHTDNGVKIVDNNGFMITTEEEDVLIKYVITDNNILKIDNDINNIYTIFIGYDTRKSSPIILSEIISGINNYGNIKIINFGLCTTPEHHSLIIDSEYNNKILNLMEYENNFELTLDCANGVGSILFESLLYTSRNVSWDSIFLTNNNYNNYELLNEKCGTDYYINNINNIFELENGLYAAVDGDADRSIFFTIKEYKIENMYDGDYLSLIYLKYLVNFCKVEQSNICVVYTSYSNTGYIEYLKKNYDQINIKCSKTGVKNCDKIARNENDFGIYFENNGHGTFLNNKSNNVGLLNYANNIVGDAVINIFLVLCILTEMKMKFENFLFYKYKLSNYKIHNVKNIHDYINDEYEIILIHPINIVEKINKLIIKYGLIRIFIRKSGTENVLRILIEGGYDHGECFLEIQEIIL